MGGSQKRVSQKSPLAGAISLRGYLPTLIILATISSVAGFQIARPKSAWWKWESIAPVQAASFSGSQARISEVKKTEDEELRRLSPQQQAEFLLDRAIQNHEESLDLIPQFVDSWRGHLQESNRLFDLVLVGLKADDLSVRAAAVEVDLAANNLNKSPGSIARLIHQIRNDPVNRPLALWRLGALGNRGVEPQIVLANLLTYARDRNERTRYWAVEGLAMLGTDDTIDPLLDRFAHDASPRVRERAASSLAKAGMLTKDQRLTAVPDLLNFLDDDSFDSTTRGWVYAALRVITGASIGNDASAWRNWWKHHDSAQKRPSLPAGMLLA